MRRSFRIASLVGGVLAVALAIPPSASAHDPNSAEGRAEMERIMSVYEPNWRAAPITGAAATPCVNGMAGSYPCKNTDLLSYLPLNSMGGGRGNSMWHWRDSSTSKEYILVAKSTGVAFVDVTTPTSPRYLGSLPSYNGTSSSWRDVRVYQNHAYVGADAINTHGIQVMDLAKLRGVTTPQTFSADARYTGLGNSHTLAINEETGYLYASGSNTCSTGVHMIDIRTPKSPRNAGCIGNDGYTHEQQCINYNGPDTQHRGREICLNYNLDTVNIVDVTSKTSWRQLSRTGYPNAQYTHQGTFTQDHRYITVNDELDSNAGGYKLHIYDALDLDRPIYMGYWLGKVPATDHNHYTVGKYIYQAAYRAGLRVLDTTGIANKSLDEVAYFDVYPSANDSSMNGAWQVNPYLSNGVVAINGIESGLFLVKPNLGGTTPTPTTAPPTTTPPTTTPPTTTPPGGCSDFPSVYNGTLASGASAYQPNNSYYQTTVSGTHAACLDGPSGTDYDLYLQKWNGSAWGNVASGSTPDADESISYSGSAGYYRYRVHAYSGSGSYTLGIRKP